MDRVRKAICLNHGYSKAVVVDVVSHSVEWSPSLTDASFYTPVGSLVRKLNSQDKIPMNHNPLYYDFPDYKDNGMQLPVSRRPDADISEISMAVRTGVEEVEKGIRNSRKRSEESKQDVVGSSDVVDSQQAE